MDSPRIIIPRSLKDWFWPAMKDRGVTTSTDILKAAALALMVIDHLGYLFWPEQAWLRAVGRASAPIWFFLIGYHFKAELPLRWLLGGMLLSLAGFLSPAIHDFFPLNILIVFLALRLTLPWLKGFFSQRPEYITIFWVMCAALTPLLSPWIEYGLIGFIWALLGTIYRTPEAWPRFSSLGQKMGLLVAAAFLYGLTQTFVFGFSLNANGLMGLGLLGVVVGLWFFSHAPLIAATRPILPLNIFGAYSFEIYVGHFLVFILLFSMIR